MTGVPRATIRELTGVESQALLARNWVGRLAYCFHDRVDVEPIHYAYDAPWIFGRTSPGAKLVALAHNQWCAFEVDEVPGMLEWQSVVVKGPLTIREPGHVGTEYDRALAAIRRVIPSALAADDPAPQRTVLFGIHASEISGRRSNSVAEPSAGRFLA